jgi:hypothetical protein
LGGVGGPQDATGTIRVIKGGEVDAGLGPLGHGTEPAVTVEIRGGVPGVGRVDLDRVSRSSFAYIAVMVIMFSAVLDDG